MATFYPIVSYVENNGQRREKLIGIRKGIGTEESTQRLEAATIAAELAPGLCVLEPAKRMSQIVDESKIVALWREALASSEDAMDFRVRFSLDKDAAKSEYKRWHDVAALRLGKAFRELGGGESSGSGKVFATAAEAPAAEAPQAEKAGKGK